MRTTPKSTTQKQKSVKAGKLNLSEEHIRDLTPKGSGPKGGRAKLSKSGLSFGVNC